MKHMIKLSCKQIIAKINAIKSNLDDFGVELGKGEIEKSLNLKDILIKMIDELKRETWGLEILNLEEIQKQYGEWQKVYENLNLGIELPSLERIEKFLQKDIAFLELMKTKEKQGLTKMIIAPAPGFYLLGNLITKIGQAIESRGGAEGSVLSPLWQKMLKSEKDIRYFGRIVEKAPANIIFKDGVTSEEIEQNPDKYSIVDGWMISFTTKEQEIAEYYGNRNTGNGRIAIKAKKDAVDYQIKYFSVGDEMYVGEEPMIPQEQLSLLAKYVFENTFLDSLSATWFLSTYFPGETALPYIFGGDKISCAEYSPNSRASNLGVRAVVRRNLKS